LYDADRTDWPFLNRLNDLFNPTGWPVPLFFRTNQKSSLIFNRMKSFVVEGFNYCNHIHCIYTTGSIVGNMVINTCSSILKSLGFNENDHFVNGFEICFFGSFAAMNFPIRPCLFQGKWIPGIHFPYFPMFGNIREK
jgi:hypothetical protein